MAGESERPGLRMEPPLRGARVDKTFGVANGTDTGSGGAINVGYQSNGWFKLSTTPLFFTRTGYLWDTEYRDTTTLALYWSATSYSGTNAYTLLAVPSDLYPAVDFDRGHGFVVRCLARRRTLRVMS